MTRARARQGPGRCRGLRDTLGRERKREVEGSICVGSRAANTQRLLTKPGQTTVFLRDGSERLGSSNVEDSFDD